MIILAFVESLLLLLTLLLLLALSGFLRLFIVALRLLSRQGFHGGQAKRPNGLRCE